MVFGEMAPCFDAMAFGQMAPALDLMAIAMRLDWI
jgi:hypothetical protein